MNNTIKADVGYSVHKDPDFIKINTTIDFGIDSIYNQVSERIIQMEDGAIKEALKKLGWLSPEEAAMLQEDYYNRGYEQGCSDIIRQI